jgi:hypothetical protein
MLVSSLMLKCYTRLARSKHPSLFCLNANEDDKKKFGSSFSTLGVAIRENNSLLSKKLKGLA